MRIVIDKIPPRFLIQSMFRGIQSLTDSLAIVWWFPTNLEPRPYPRSEARYVLTLNGCITPRSPDLMTEPIVPQKTSSSSGVWNSTASSNNTKLGGDRRTSCVLLFRRLPSPDERHQIRAAPKNYYFLRADDTLDSQNQSMWWVLRDVVLAMQGNILWSV